MPSGSLSASQHRDARYKVCQRGKNEMPSGSLSASQHRDVRYKVCPRVNFEDYEIMKISRITNDYEDCKIKKICNFVSSVFS